MLDAVYVAIAIAFFAVWRHNIFTPRTPAAGSAGYYASRIARAMSEDQVRRVLNQYTEGRTIGILGEPRVNVLKLNLALDGR